MPRPSSAAASSRRDTVSDSGTSSAQGQGVRCRGANNAKVPSAERSPKKCTTTADALIATR